MDSFINLFCGGFKLNKTKIYVELVTHNNDGTQLKQPH